jgi:hypothetical protein
MKCRKSGDIVEPLKTEPDYQDANPIKLQVASDEDIVEYILFHVDTEGSLDELAERSKGRKDAEELEKIIQDDLNKLETELKRFLGQTFLLSDDVVFSRNAMTINDAYEIYEKVKRKKENSSGDIYSLDILLRDPVIKFKGDDEEYTFDMWQDMFEEHNEPSELPTGMAIDEENYFDAAQALYWFAYANHEGQWSDLYSILSTMGYTPARSEKGIDKDS